jgi:hydrogenase nickel incorporation protein HypB
MCKECGCGLPGDDPVQIRAHDKESGGAREHSHPHPHTHGGDHNHSHDHGHDHHHHHYGHDEAHSHTYEHEVASPGAVENPSQAPRTLEIRRSILEKNERLAERNRGFFQARKLLVLNVLSSPGSGKTTLLTETIRILEPELKCGVIVGDLATDNDARRLGETGAPVVQITTGTVCHLEAEMVGRAVAQIDLAGLHLLFIENVGNLVCPASYDLGEHLRVVLVSVTEGEDKPLKYPPIFQSANAVVVSKMDLAEACGFSRETLMGNLRRVAPNARVLELSTRSGQGMEDWKSYLLQEQKRRQDRCFSDD